ncbi:hypothetical protein BMS3Bbin14_00971 [bacterium BMS3Bbin14]|nr:hypothetical protein BMS3Bbin14_00971 [bacterium BMS3Bbin14]
MTLHAIDEIYCIIFVTVHLHPIFVRFALLRYREYTSEGETNESGAHLNGYSYELRVVYCLW